MKLWIDDVRPAPAKEWVWLRSVNDAGINSPKENKSCETCLHKDYTMPQCNECIIRDYKYYTPKVGC